MEILQNFGFEPYLFVGQIVNFLILFFLFKKFLYKPILKVLHDREKKIKQGIEDAEMSHRALEEAQTKEEQIIKTAAQEAEKIIEDTKKTAEELRETILSDAKKSAEKIMTEAKKQAEDRMNEMEKRAKEASLEISEKILEKMVNTLFSKEEKEKIMKRSMDSIKKFES